MKGIGWLMIVLVALAWVLQGCGQSGGQNENEIQLTDNAYIFEDSDRASIASVQEDSILFQTKPTFATGSVIVNDTGQVLLRKVKTIRELGNGQFEVQTEQAALADLIAEGEINLTVPLEYTPTIQSQSQLEAQGLTYDNGKWCVDNTDNDGIFQVDACFGLEVELKLEAKFDLDPSKTELKIYLRGGLSGTFEPKLVWKLAESIFKFELEYALTVLASSPEISIGLGRTLKIPVEVGPVIAFGVYTGLAHSQTDALELSVSLFKIEASLDLGEIGAQSKAWRTPEPYFTGPNFEVELTGPSASISRSSEDETDFESELLFGPKFQVSIFGQKNFEAYFESYIESKPVMTWNGLLPRRVDYDPAVGLRAGLEGGIDLEVWKLRLKTGFDVQLFEKEFWQRCGSLPPDGSVTLEPDVAELSIGQRQTFTAMIEGYPYLLGDCKEGVTWSLDQGSFVSTNDKEAVFDALESGNFTVTAKSSADESKTATARVTVDGNVPRVFISGTIAGLTPGDWGATVLYPTLLANPTNFFQLGTSASVDADGNFSLDISNITPPTLDSRVQLVPISPPDGVTVDPEDVTGAEFSLIVFNDLDNDENLDTGETFYLLNDRDNTFVNRRPSSLQYAENDYTMTGESETTTGKPVNWNVAASEGWGRFIFQDGVEVNVSYSGVLSDLRLELGSSFTPQALATMREANEFVVFKPQSKRR